MSSCERDGTRPSFLSLSALFSLVRWLQEAMAAQEGDRESEVVETEGGATLLSFDQALTLEHLRPLENFNRRFNKVRMVSPFFLF